MKILLTGGAGFIGSHIQDRLIDEGHEVAIVDNFRSGQKENINFKAKVFEINILDKEKITKVFKEFGPEVVYHLAAQNEVAYSMDYPFEDQETNIVGTMNVMEAIKISGALKIIYSNTGGALYGEVEESLLPINEDTIPLKPTSFYGVSKGSAEMYIRLYANLYNISWVALRYANVYGPRQAGNKECGIVAIFTQKMLNGESPTINGDGSHTRDYVYVEDVVEANIKALEFNKSDYFNISCGIEVSNIEVFNVIERNLKSGKQIGFGPERPGDPKRIALSNQKAKKILGWAPKNDFATGVSKTIEYYKL